MAKAIFKGILIVLGLVILVPLIMVLILELGPFMTQVENFISTYNQQLLIVLLAGLLMFFYITSLIIYESLANNVANKKITTKTTNIQITGNQVAVSVERSFQQMQSEKQPDGSIITNTASVTFRRDGSGDTTFDIDGFLRQFDIDLSKSIR